MSLLRNFVIRGPEQAQSLHTFLKNNAAAMAERGEPLEVRVSVYKERATDEQRSLIWVINEQIAEQAWIGGRRYDAETWHEHAKREHLPAETAKGIKKWRHLPDGTRALAMGTQHLNRAEKSEYIEKLLAWAATDLGVQIQILETAQG